MPLAVAFDDVKATRTRQEGVPAKGTTGAVTTTAFFKAKDVPDFPHAVLSQRDPGRFSSTHFHRVDQFQVTIAGQGKIGRHDLVPYSVHFSRAYTPYGPLLSDDRTGLTFFVMRARFDSGSQRIPKEMPQLQQVPHRQPFQMSRSVTIPARGSSAGANAVLEAVPDFKDNRGLAAYTLNMGPNSAIRGPDPSGSGGQYYVVVKGSLWHDNKEHKAWALVFVWPKDGPFEIRAGADGLEAIVVNFPQPVPVGAHPPARNTDLKAWQCPLCAFTYDEAAGLPHEGIPAGTRWSDMPENWTCPDCSASKHDFQMIE